MMASAYSRANPGMWLSGGYPFENGTVQGASWYTVLGSMQVLVLRPAATALYCNALHYILRCKALIRGAVLGRAELS